MGDLDISTEKAWVISIPQHLPHTGNHHGWGERSTYNKWESKENFIYTQHQRTDCNITANIHWESGSQIWRPSPHQTSHCMVQPQETTWRCTAHEQKIHSSQPPPHSWYDEAEVVNDRFLSVCSIHPSHLLWLHHAVRSLVGRCSSELRATFPMNVSYNVAICYLMLIISKKSSLLSHLWCVDLSPQSCWCLVCVRWCGVGIPQFFRRDFRSGQLSHTHSSRFMGMVRKISYLLQLSTLAYVQNLARAPIDAFPVDRCESTS